MIQDKIKNNELILCGDIANIGDFVCCTSCHTDEELGYDDNYDDNDFLFNGARTDVCCAARIYVEEIIEANKEVEK